MSKQHGTSLVEVLVTILILAFGLLGLAGLQSRLQVADVEAYQHAQALVLIEDMASRITSNRAVAASYVINPSSPLAASACPTSFATRQQIDALQWCNALQGAAEIVGGQRVGAMIKARGCVEALPGNEYLITVAWQGLNPTTPPPASITCGLNEFDDPLDGCSNDSCRRVATTIVRIADLD